MDYPKFTYRPAPPHRGQGAYRVYAPGADDGLPVPPGSQRSGFVGDIYPVYTEDGSVACWDTHTQTVQLPGHPEDHSTGYRTREAAARHMWSVRQGWARRAVRRQAAQGAR